ncbi:hypothetical protein VTL71DRAFT_1886 [Oculimacula yallundae]|uniref:2EXR domain-containing protein n=1 Tax=Oculimacula yallundae TaxID=86028 RepID=A0ABR4CDC1_9HELO
MSTKNRSNKSSPKHRDAREIKRKINKTANAKIVVEDDKKPESLAEVVNSPNPASVEKQIDEPTKKPVVQEVPWSDWMWDEGPGRWYKARMTADKTWEYQCTEPSMLILSPDPIPHFAAATTFEYPEKESKVLFANEVIYQVPNCKGGYQLAVRLDERFWAVEKASSVTKAKEDPKKVESVAEKKDDTSDERVVITGADDSQEPSAEDKVQEKPSIAPTEPKQVIEKSSSKKTKAEVAQGPAKSPVYEKEKKDKRSSRLKIKKAYIELDEEDEPRHRGRARERKRAFYGCDFLGEGPVGSGSSRHDGQLLPSPTWDEEVRSIPTSARPNMIGTWHFSSLFFVFSFHLPINTFTSVLVIPLLATVFADMPVARETTPAAGFEARRSSDIPFPAVTPSTPSRSRSSPVYKLNSDEDEVQFLSSRPVNPSPAVKKIRDLGPQLCRACSKNTALKREASTLRSNNTMIINANVSPETKIIKIEGKNPALGSRDIVLDIKVVEFNDERQTQSPPTPQQQIKVSGSCSSRLSDKDVPLRGRVSLERSSSSMRVETRLHTDASETLHVQSFVENPNTSSNEFARATRASAFPDHTDDGLMTLAFVPTSFQFFGKLPAELRAVIWALATHEPRVVEVHRCQGGSDVYADSAPPSLLHACAESRKVAIEKYFENYMSIREGSFVHELDYIYLGCSRRSDCISKGLCPSNCKRSLGAMLARDATGRAVYEVTSQVSPFPSISILFNSRGIEELLLVDSKHSKPDGESTISNFKEIITPFHWQGARSLLQCWKDEIGKGAKLWRIPTSLKRIVRVEYIPDSDV